MGSHTPDPRQQIEATGPQMSPPSRRTRWFCGIALVLGGLTYWAAHAGLTDDGYITLDYARTLATNGTWGMQPGLEANSATSPLHVLILALVILVIELLGGGTLPVLALGFVTVAAMVATAGWWSGVSTRLGVSWQAALTGLLLVLLSPFGVSVFGLETQLLLALLVGLFAAGLRERPVLFGVLAGLTVLARLDSVVVVLALSLALPGIRRRWWRALVPSLLVGLPWFVTSWFLLGSAIPDTLAIKQQQASFAGGWRYGNGLGLFVSSPDTTFPAVVALIPPAFGLLSLLYWVLLRRRGRLAPLAAFGGAGVLYYLVYWVMNPTAYVWYYVPTLATLTLFFAAALDPLAARLRGGRSRAVTTVIGAGLTVLTILPELVHGIPWTRPPIFGNWALPAEYAHVGKQLGQRIGDAAVQAPEELGTLVYACHCRVIDQFSDRGSAIRFLRQQVVDAGPLTGWLYRLNYHNLDWSRPPTPTKYRMEWHPGWVRPRPDVWNVRAPGYGPGHFVLLPADAPPTPRIYPREEPSFPHP